MHLEEILALNDPTELSWLAKNWAPVRRCFSLDVMTQPLDKITSYYGTKVGLYCAGTSRGMRRAFSMATACLVLHAPVMLYCGASRLRYRRPSPCYTVVAPCCVGLPTLQRMPPYTPSVIRHVCTRLHAFLKRSAHARLSFRFLISTGFDTFDKCTIGYDSMSSRHTQGS